MILIKDDKDRVLLKVNEHGQVVIGRYEDLSEELQVQVIDIFVELTGKDRNKAKAFLEYKDDEDAFCV
jgi:hypothetical protein